MKHIDSLKLISIIVILICFYPQKAYAYIDPGTGSYIFQIMIAFAVGFLFYLKIAGKSIKTFLSKYFSGSRKGDRGNGC